MSKLQLELSEIRKITPSGAVTLFAGANGQVGAADGNGTNARFSTPQCITSDVNGNLYVTDGLGTIRKVTQSADVTTVATLSSGLFGISTDAFANVYFTDGTNRVVKKLKPDGSISIVAGTLGGFGDADGIGAAASFRSLAGLVSDSAGNLYVSDLNSIRRITADGTVTTIAGISLASGSSDGVGSNARFNRPLGLALDSAGNLFVADTGNNVIRKISLPPPPPSDCATRVVSWTVRASSCSSSYPGGQNGTSTALLDSIGPVTGTATASCTNGALSLAQLSCITAPPPSILQAAVVPQPTAAPPIVAFPTALSDLLAFLNTHSTEFSPETQSFLTAAAADATPVHASLTKVLAASYADLGKKTAYDAGILYGALDFLTCPGSAAEKTVGVVATVAGATPSVPEDTKTITGTLSTMLSVSDLIKGIIKKGGTTFLKDNPACVTVTLASATMYGVEHGLVPVLNNYAIDPLDPLYQSIFTPQLDFLPSLPSTGDTATDANFTAFLGATLRAAAYLEAVNKSFDRYSTAVGARDSISATRQIGAILKYLVAYDAEMRTGGIALANLSPALRAMTPSMDSAASALVQLQRSIALDGIPTELAALLSTAGLTGAQIDAVRAEILSLDLARVRATSPDVLSRLSKVFLRASSASDVNHDGVIDFRDAVFLEFNLGTSTEGSACGIRCDINGDGRIDQSDLSLLYEVCGLACNRPPVAAASGDQTVRLGSRVTLDGTGSSDPDNFPSPLTYAWTQTGGPSVGLSNATTAKPTFTASSAGSYTFSLQVGDGATPSNISTVTITVPPLGDVNGDGSIDNIDLNLVLAALNKPASGPNDLRDLTGDGKIDNADVTLLRGTCGAACNRPPIAFAGPSQTVECAGPTGSTVQLDGSGSSDPDGDPVSYQWLGPFGTATDAFGDNVESRAWQRFLAPRVNIRIANLIRDTMSRT